MSDDAGKQRVLIVDDVSENIRILAQVLKPVCKVSFAVSGKEALDLAMGGEPIDLVLLDIMMPEMDGYEVCRQLKADERTCNIPVIFITAMDEEEDETQGLESGAVDYITKPFSEAIVRARVRTHLELKRHRDILENLSSLDGLTGIPNRRRFDECVETAWRNGLREASPLSIIMIDIDYFGAFNNTYNHLAGDDCLKRVAKTLQACLRRPTDFAARYGGEEFSVVLPGTDLEGALHIAESIRKAVEDLRIAHGASPVSDWVTVSQGVATMLPFREGSVSFLIKGSDSVLFEAKKAGRNRIKSIQL
jgi:diguanylate cyclase (GGDEF)-like protein